MGWLGKFGKSDEKIGLAGPVKKIREKALVDCPYNEKLELLSGCVCAFEKGAPENLQTFLLSYLEFKQQRGRVSDTGDFKMDDGFAFLVAQPVLELIEKSKDPDATISAITAKMSFFYKQLTLRIALRQAETEGRIAAKTALEFYGEPEDIGYKGPLEKIRAKALADENYNKKTGLLTGSLKAFDEGRPENLRAFIGAYLEFKRKKGDIAELDTKAMNEGFIELVSKPILYLIEKSKSPAQTIASVVADMSDFYKQVTLDLVLREACCSNAGSWFAAEAVLDAGADPNTGNHRALANAVNNKDTRIIEALYRYGANMAAVAGGESFKEKFSGKDVIGKKPLTTSFSAAHQKQEAKTEPQIPPSKPPKRLEF